MRLLESGVIISYLNRPTSSGKLGTILTSRYIHRRRRNQSSRPDTTRSITPARTQGPYQTPRQRQVGEIHAEQACKQIQG